MFAHHVIASLQQYYDPVKCDDPFRRKLWEDWQLFIPVIQQAQKFHVEDGDVLKDLCRSYSGQPLWEHTEQNRLPFKTTWLDYVVRQKAIPTSQLKFRSPTFGDRFRPPDGVFNEREAVLAIELTPTIWTLHTFTKINAFPMWYPEVVPMIVLIGGLSESNNEEIATLLWGREYIKKQKANGRDLICVPIVHPFLRERLTSDQIRGICEETGAENHTTLVCFLKLLHCKNITTDTIEAPARLNRKREKCGKQPLFSYRVLRVTLPSSAAGHKKTGPPIAHNRVHLCRGHFKEYTQENPLFGRHTGLYWWQPHVRGQNRDGVVMKDYSVKHKN